MENRDVPRVGRRQFLAGLGGFLAGVGIGEKIFSDKEPSSEDSALLRVIIQNAKDMAQRKGFAVSAVESGIGAQTNESKETKNEARLFFPEVDVLSEEFNEAVSSMDGGAAIAINNLKSKGFSGHRDLGALSDFLLNKWREIYGAELDHQRKERNMDAVVGSIFLEESVIAPLAQRASQETGVPAWVIVGVIGVESGGDAYAYNLYSGAAGIMQITEITAKEAGINVDWEKGIDDRFDMEKNVMAAAKYLRKLYERFGQWSLALAAYSGGHTKLQERIISCSGRNKVGRADFGGNKNESGAPPALGLRRKGVNIATLYSAQFCGLGKYHSVQYPFWVEAMAKSVQERIDKVSK